MKKSEIIQDIKDRSNQYPFLKDVKIKDIVFTDGIGNGQVIIEKNGIDFTLAAFFVANGLAHFFMSQEEMIQQFKKYKEKHEHRGS